MPKRKPVEEAPQAEAVPAAVKPEKAPAPVTLKLRENHFVRGEFAPGGSLHQFSPEEAIKRLAKTQLWDRV